MPESAENHVLSHASAAAGKQTDKTREQVRELVGREGGANC
jgi:hypothetical protein